jgi:hypothetical protein
MSVDAIVPTLLPFFVLILYVLRCMYVKNEKIYEQLKQDKLKPLSVALLHEGRWIHVFVNADFSCYVNGEPAEGMAFPTVFASQLDPAQVDSLLLHASKPLDSLAEDKVTYHWNIQTTPTPSELKTKE